MKAIYCDTCNKLLQPSEVETCRACKPITGQQLDAQHASLLRELVMSMQAEQRARREFMRGVFGKTDLTGEQRRRINVMVEALSITADAREVGESQMNDIWQALD